MQKTVVVKIHVKREIFEAKEENLYLTSNMSPYSNSESG